MSKKKMNINKFFRGKANTTAEDAVEDVALRKARAKELASKELVDAWVNLEWAFREPIEYTIA